MALPSSYQRTPRSVYEASLLGSRDWLWPLLPPETSLSPEPSSPPPLRRPLLYGDETGFMSPAATSAATSGYGDTWDPARVNPNAFERMVAGWTANPVKTLSNLAFGLFTGPVGWANMASGLAGGPTFGGTLSGIPGFIGDFFDSTAPSVNALGQTAMYGWGNQTIDAYGNPVGSLSNIASEMNMGNQGYDAADDVEGMMSDAVQAFADAHGGEVGGGGSGSGTSGSGTSGYGDTWNTGGLVLADRSPGPPSSVRRGLGSLPDAPWAALRRMDLGQLGRGAIG